MHLTVEMPTRTVTRRFHIHVGVGKSVARGGELNVMQTGFRILACLCSIAFVCTCAAKIPDSQLATKLSISIRQLHTLRASYNLTDDQLLGLTPVQLQQIVSDDPHPGIDKHRAEMEYRLQRMVDEHGHIPEHALENALEHRKHLAEDEDLFPVPPDLSTNVLPSGTPGPQVAGLQTNIWTWLGPGNIGGRVRSILVHPTSTNIMWCGGVDGGVWKTTNAGASWFPLNDFMPNLAVSCMVMDPSNPNTIYVGTGEAAYNFDAIRGAGIFRTSDGGTTWTQLSSTANATYFYISRLAIQSNNNQVILAATRSGVYRSTDAGASWSLTLSVSDVECVAFNPTDGTKCVASTLNGTAYYSTTSGSSWAAATGIPTAVTGAFGVRAELAYAPGSPTTVYASVDHNSGEVYISTDGGHTYSLRNTGTSYLSGQGWYANVVAVDPTNPNNVLVGGLDLWRSTDGGSSFTQISQWFSAPSSAHADHHAIVVNPGFGVNNNTVFFGNDGGIYRASNVFTVSLTSGWQSLNNNLGITQFYGAGGNTNSGTIVGGTQDNGTIRYTTALGAQGWTTMFGGDGGVSAADPTNPNYFYGEYIDLQIHRSTDGGVSSSYIFTGIADAGSSALFIAPFILDPNNANTMLAGGASLWRSANVKATTPSWSAIKPSVGPLISAIAVAPGNSDVIWVGHTDGSIYSTGNGTSASPTWTLRSSGLPARYCTRIAVSPFSSSKVYVTFGGYSSGNVWRTINGGANWTSITGNLPAAPMNTIAVHPSAQNTVYVGSDVGVFATQDDGVTWSTSNEGPANCAVDELFWMGNTLVAVTHGRGLFSITPLLVPDAVLVTNNITVSSGNGNGLIDFNECNQLKIVLKNNGNIAASNVTAVLSSSTPGLSVVQNTSTYPTIGVGATATNTSAFTVSTTLPYQCGSIPQVALTIYYNGKTNVLNFALPASGSGYVVTQSTGASIVSGVADIGNHSDDVATTINLPFAYTLYDQSFSTIAVDSNGKVQFGSGSSDYRTVCLPATYSYAIYPFWADLRTDQSGGGIFISTNGVAPNRIFNIEWRAVYYSSAASVNFELRLYEGQSRFDLIYGSLNGTASSVNTTVGVQRDATTATSFTCISSALSAGLQLVFQPQCSDGGGACSSSLPPGKLASFTSTSTSNFTMSFVTDGSSAYTFEYKSNLTDLSWITLATYTAPPQILSISDDPSSVSQRFYRIRSGAQTSDIAGFVNLRLLSNSDTFVSIPFVRPAVAIANVASVSANVVTVSGGGWTAGQFVYNPASQTNSYYARFLSGNAAGKIFPIITNSTASVSLNLGNDSLNNVVSGDQFSIEPYWTLASVFPNGAGINASPLAGSRNTELLVPDFTSSGMNLSAAAVYFFNGGLWKRVGQGNTNFNDTILYPNTHFIVRHNVATNTVLTTGGLVAASPLAVALRTTTTNHQDNSICLVRPVSVTLNASQLISSGAFASSPLPGSRTDELLTFDNTIAQKNKSSANVYYYWSNAWRRVGSGTNDFGNNAIFTPGTGFIIRKNTNTTSPTWITTPTW
jgi:uncharacterized protein (TIGR02597 family)